MKFEGSGSKGTQVIEQKRSVTDGQTDKAKTNMSPPEGVNIISKTDITELLYSFIFQVLKKNSNKPQEGQYGHKSLTCLNSEWLLLKEVAANC